MEETVSIIIPIYKVEKYLHECIDSALAQTYQNLEIILVDDGSPDNCPQICDDYAKTDTRIKVIHKTNRGLSDARNTGVQASTGQYIFFLDSDDRIESNTIEFLLGLIRQYDAQVAITSRKFKNTWQVYSASGPEMAIDVLHYYRWEAWGKLFHRSLVENVRFPVGEIYEDLGTIPLMIYPCRRAVYSDSGLYHYRVREDSIMGMDAICIRTDLIKQAESVLHFFKTKDKTEYSKALYFTTDYLRRKMRHVIKTTEEKKRNHDFLKAFRRCLIHYYPAILIDKEVPLRKKIGTFLDIIRS